MKGKIFNGKEVPEEEIKRKFELEYKKLLKGWTNSDYRVLTRKSYKINDNEITTEEFNETLLACLGVAIRYVPEIKRFNPTPILDKDIFEVRIKYER